MSGLDFGRFMEEALQDPELRAAHEALEAEFRIKSAIIEARISRGVTQKDLAKALGTTQSAVSRWETGPFDPRLTNLLRLAAALGVTFELSPEGLRVTLAEAAEVALAPTELASEATAQVTGEPNHWSQRFVATILGGSQRRSSPARLEYLTVTDESSPQDESLGTRLVRSPGLQPAFRETTYLN